MESLEKEFVPYELALKMKQLGFDEPCFGFHSAIHDLMICNTKSVNEIVGECLAPTFSQAFRFFRDKYNLKGHVEPVEYLDGTPDTYHWSIFDNYNSGNDQITHEEAELACLEKLIEILENK
jgi:hypothetical protein